MGKWFSKRTRKVSPVCFIFSMTSRKVVFLVMVRAGLGIKHAKSSVKTTEIL
ncbi:hypothetical protein [Thermodesulfobacterium commune]|uniref:hypothetical protein n=1 Tax=Thermodesulfobacterium commune TaxID=1741 RepID=UPI002352B3BD